MAAGWFYSSQEYVPFPEPLPLLGKAQLLNLTYSWDSAGCDALHHRQVESYLDKCIEWFQKALKFFAKQDARMAKRSGCTFFLVLNGDVWWAIQKWWVWQI